MTTYSEDTKAQVMAALLAGQSVSAVARQYSIPRTTILRWRDMSEPVASVTDSKKGELGELIFDYLRKVLNTLAIQAEQFGDTQWLKKQPASEVAVLHGVLTDKAIRILEALETDEGAAATDTG